MQKTPLKRKTPLKVKLPLRQKTLLQSKTSLKAKQKTARKRKEPYFSIFTADMHCCVITGSTEHIDPHHIFSGCDKAFSEKYGFMVPLRRDWHEGTTYSIHQDRELELRWKLKCQEYWINVLGKTKEDWLKECRMWYLGKAA